MANNFLFEIFYMIGNSIYQIMRFAMQILQYNLLKQQALFLKISRSMFELKEKKIDQSAILVE